MAVLEFFMFEKRCEDEQLLELVSGLAMQLGSIIEGKRLEEAYRLLSTFKVGTTTWLRPGVSFSAYLDEPMTTAKYSIVTIDVPVAF